jgi:hypothetical protein
VDAVLESLAGTKAAEARARFEHAELELRQARDTPSASAETAVARPAPDKARVKALKEDCGRLEAIWRNEAKAGIAERHPVTTGLLHLDNVAKGGLDRKRFVELAQASDRAPYLPGLAADVDLESGKKTIIARTHLSFSNGGSNKMLLKDFAALAALATASRVEDGVFGEGTILDGITGLGWDPASQRSYALQFSDPQDEVRCHAVHHALAFLGLAMFPVLPAGRDRSTLGVYAFPDVGGAAQSDDETEAEDETGNSETSKGRTGRPVEYLTWPIWETALRLDDVRSLFCRRELAERSPPADRCRTIGITTIFRSRRFALNKRSYFAPARPMF